MDSEDLLMLTEAHWRAIAHLSDALVEAADLQDALQAGLQVLLAALDRPGAALYLPCFSEQMPPEWTFCCAPAEWQAELPGQRSPLCPILDQVRQSSQVAAGLPELNLAAAFPIQASGRPARGGDGSGAGQAAGVLLVSGPLIQPAEYSLWLAFLRPIARWVTLLARSGGGDGAPTYPELARSRDTLRAIFDSLPQSIYIIDRAFQLAAVNQARAARAGLEPRQAVGRRCHEALFRRSEPCQGCRVAETFEGGLSTQRLTRYWFDGERFIDLEISTFPILDVGDVAIQSIIVEIDVTEKRSLEANLIQAEKLAAIGQLAAGVAHEINNPLTAIIANAQLLRRAIPPEQADILDSVNLIEMAGTRASQVVRNLLTITRKEKLEYALIDLNDTLHHALSLVQHELVGRPIQVYLSLEDGIPSVMASQDQLQGVWINLILNAIDAIDKDNGEISINSHYNGREFQITITDNGKGISPEHLLRVFEPFFTTKAAGRGTGLGLSVCKRVIRQHGGDIHVESQAGSWTRFTVSLPGTG